MKTNESPTARQVMMESQAVIDRLRQRAERAEAELEALKCCGNCAMVFIPACRCDATADELEPDHACTDRCDRWEKRK